MKDYKIISRFYRMENTYILLAHGILPEESAEVSRGGSAPVPRNIHSVVGDYQRLETRLHKHSDEFILPLIADICKGEQLYKPHVRNVKVSACKDTIGYAGLYIGIKYPERPDIVYPTRIRSFEPNQKFMLFELYDWLEDTNGPGIKLIFVGCIAPVRAGIDNIIRLTYDEEVKKIRDAANNRESYQSRLIKNYPPLDLRYPYKFPTDRFPVTTCKRTLNGEIKTECKEECDKDCEILTQPYDGSQGGSRRKTKKKKRKRLSKHSRKKKHTRRLNRRV